MRSCTHDRQATSKTRLKDCEEVSLENLSYVDGNSILIPARRAFKIKIETLLVAMRGKYQFGPPAQKVAQDTCSTLPFPCCLTVAS